MGSATALDREVALKKRKQTKPKKCERCERMAAELVIAGIRCDRMRGELYAVAVRLDALAEGIRKAQAIWEGSR